MFDDLRYALRTLRKNPGFALVAIVSLALGIGASSATFSSADALVLRPLSVPHGSSVVRIQSQLRGEARGRVSYPDYADLRDRNRSFTGLTASQTAFFGFAPEK